MPNVTIPGDHSRAFGCRLIVGGRNPRGSPGLYISEYSILEEKRILTRMSTIKHNMSLREIPLDSNVCQLLLLDHQWVLAGELCLLLLLSYLIYIRTLHPLAKYPGPLLASLTNSWKAYYVYKLFFHEKLIELHQRYGPVVRVGPNHLHFWDGNAIAPIYKGGRSMGKSEFYDAFTAFNPNLFGTTNDDVSDCRVMLGTPWIMSLTIRWEYIDTFSSSTATLSWILSSLGSKPGTFD